MPYFKDSTPSWSTRGKLRRQLLPLLLDMYGDGCLRNLSSLARDSDEAHQMVTRTVYSPFFEYVLSLRVYPSSFKNMIHEKRDGSNSFTIFVRGTTSKK